mgnify:CR=1 FL=1
MDNYEINILRRSGDWKKISPDDLILDDVDNSSNEIAPKDDDFLSKLNEVKIIIEKLENLEKQKDKLKIELKIFEEEFVNKKKNIDDKIITMSEKAKMVEKTIGLIKNLKSI